MEPANRPLASLVADGLTLSRLAIAVTLVPAAWGSSLDGVAILLSVAWATDVADGRVVRAHRTQGRLGTWDFAVDAAVGAGLVVGLTGSGTIPLWAGATCLVVLGTLVARGNLAAGMLLQLAGYVPVGILLWTERPTWWLTPFATVAAIAVLDWRRLVTVQVPTFFGGLAELGRRRRPTPAEPD